MEDKAPSKFTRRINELKLLYGASNVILVTDVGHVIDIDINVGTDPVSIAEQRESLIEMQQFLKRFIKKYDEQVERLGRASRKSGKSKKIEVTEG